MAPFEVPELTVHTHTHTHLLLCSLGQLLTHSRQGECEHSYLLTGPSTSSSSSLCRGRPGAHRASPCSCAGSQAQSLCLQIPAGLSRLQTQSLRAKKLPKAKDGRENDHGQLSPFREWPRRPLPTLKTWCNSSFQHKELFTACRNSTALKIRLKYFAELEPWSGELCPSNRKASLRSRRWHAMASEHCNMPIKGFKMYLLKHTQKLRRVWSQHPKRISLLLF